MNWLAIRVGTYKFDSGPGSWPEDDQRRQAFEKGDPMDWDIVKGGSVNGRFETSAQGNMQPSGETDAQTVMKARTRLARLCRWKGPASALAVSVANSIEVAMNTLSQSRCDTFSWSLKARVRGATEAQDIWFTAQMEDGWAVEATDIEAALSLMLFAVHEEEKVGHADEGWQRDWLRHGDKALKKKMHSASRPADPQRLQRSGMVDSQWQHTTAAGKTTRGHSRSAQLSCFHEHGI
jgi:hypothetical protein